MYTYLRAYEPVKVLGKGRSHIQSSHHWNTFICPGPAEEDARRISAELRRLASEDSPFSYQFGGKSYHYRTCHQDASGRSIVQVHAWERALFFPCLPGLHAEIGA